jgi:hypothetical protein
MWWRLPLLLGLAGAPPAPESPVPFALLQQAVDARLGAPDRWAFTQRTIEYGRGQPRERLERYDPSQPVDRRWTLLALDGRTPTAEERAGWAVWRARRLGPRLAPSPLDYLDLDRARRLGSDGPRDRWEVPLRSSHRWLFPVEKIRVLITVDREARSIERLTAEVREPFRVLLGLARITDGLLDLSFPADGGEGAVAGPRGTIHVSLYRLGDRAEFTWSDFRPVGPPRR